MYFNATGLNWEGSFGGPDRDRTDDLFHAMEARSQLRHRPTRAEYNSSIVSALDGFVNQPGASALMGVAMYNSVQRIDLNRRHSRLCADVASWFGRMRSNPHQRGNQHQGEEGHRYAEHHEDDQNPHPDRSH